MYTPLICICNIYWVKYRILSLKWYSKILCHIFSHFSYWNSTMFWLVSHFFIFINRCQKLSLWKMESPIFCYLHCVKILGLFTTFFSISFAYFSLANFCLLPHQSSTLVLKCVYTPLICICNIPWVKYSILSLNWYSKILCHIFSHFSYWNSTMFWLVSHFFIFINRCQKLSLWKMESPILCYLHCVKILGLFTTLFLLVLLILV